MRGRPIQELIGNASFAEVVWLLTRGDMPNPPEARLLKAGLVAAVDHGPQAPSIAAAHMAVTCGLALNGAIGTAAHMLDDMHGGAGEHAVELLGMALACDGDETARARRSTAGKPSAASTCPASATASTARSTRAPRLLALVDKAATSEIVTGQYAAAARERETELAARAGRKLPLYIEGATAVVYAELGFAAPLARGLFCLVRSAGALAHGWEQMQQGWRIKGPVPPQYRWTADPNTPVKDQGKC